MSASAPFPGPIANALPSQQRPLRTWHWSRHWLLMGGIAILTGAAAFSLLPRGSASEDQKVVVVNKPVEIGQTGAAGEVHARLPIGQVVLFSSGVGYFQREGTVDGDARVDLTFDVKDINDLIKSMVIRDLDGGHVGAVSYDSNAPVERTLKSFALNLNDNPPLYAILLQARGEKVEAVVQTNKAGQVSKLTGTIVGVEALNLKADKIEEGAVAVLNLWCADGVHSIKMTDVQTIRFLNPNLEGEFRKALETLATSHDTAKKAVSINFSGEGKRNVRVGYVVENPIWKTSYRLVLDKERKVAPFLQGWAVVENPTDEDWKDVRMTLVSGRPISFQMDLYTPLFVPRPLVEPDLFASLRPVAYSGGSNITSTGLITNTITAPPPPPGPDVRSAVTYDVNGIGARLEGAAQYTSEIRGTFILGNRLTNPSVRQTELQEAKALANTTRSVAQAAKLGDFFQYAIDRPVTLPRQKSALLPILNKEVEATRLSIYNEQTQAKYPLLGLRLKNTSGAHLMQGPITVFEGSNYAGDARILDLQPNEERLLSYAVDLGTEVNAVPSSDNGRLTSVKAIKGVVYTTTKVRETKTYTIANRNDQERTLLIEHPVRNEFKLVNTDKPIETAADFNRFEVKVPAGKDGKLVVTEERVVNSTVAINNLDDNNIRIFLNNPVTSPKVKAAFEEAMALRSTVAKTQQEMAEQDRQLKIIVEDQARLRANLKEMPATAAAYKRYIEKFDTQETQIETFQKEISRQQAIEAIQKKAFENYLAELNVE